MKTSPALGLVEFVALFALMMSLTGLSIDALLPGFTAIEHTLNVPDARNLQLIVSLFILGMAMGEIVFGPLADAIGRKRAIVLGISIYLLGSLVAASATSLEMLLIGRVIQGVGVAGPKIASRALIRDQFEGDAMARIMSFIMMIFILTPMIAPSIGQGILFIADWRAIFGLYLLMATVALTWLMIRQPETLLKENRIRLHPVTLVKTCGLIVRHPRVMVCTLIAGMLFGTLLSYVSTSQAIFTDVYHAGEHFPLYFALLALGSGVASFINSRWVMRFGMQKMITTALGIMACAAAVLWLVSLYFDGAPPLPVFLLGGFFLMFATGLLFGNVNALGMKYLGRVAGTGASLMSSFSSGLAVLIAIPVGRLYDGTVLLMPAAFFCCGLIGLALMLWARTTHERSV
ncbi:multidrug effflux MFS transporter [Pokkaliibacter sp. CJK22405]|uniref:multidrug effflux MFS transporter n=1 Tax=Pokkaliibacter sp. CJK22405 TaxID=3384615 RepID=UPI00398530C9